MKRFTKIKFNGEVVRLEWRTKLGKTDWIHHSLESKDAPDRELPDALSGFIEPVMGLLDLPSGYDEGLQVVGLSINYEDEDGDPQEIRRGLVVTCRKELDRTNTPLILNTPHLREWMEDDPDGCYVPDAMLDCLFAAENAAGRYIDGRRAQRDLFDEESERQKVFEDEGPVEDAERDEGAVDHPEGAGPYVVRQMVTSGDYEVVHSEDDELVAGPFRDYGPAKAIADKKNAEEVVTA